MKKIKSYISIMLSSVMILGMAVPVKTFATEDEITKKDVTAYLYSMENSETLQCLFKSNMADMPYISTVDFCNNVFKEEVTEEKNADGTYTVSNPDGSMIINTDSDTLYFDVFESFIGSEAYSEGSLLDSPYCRSSETVVNGEIKSITLALGEYDIDILEDDGRTYLPLSTASLLFSQTYNAAEYVDGNIYFLHSSDMMTGGFYFDRTGIYEDDNRSKEMIDLTYHELCFAFDKMYGRPAKAEIAASVEEKGFDKTLDEFSDETRRAKELMMSDSKSDFIYGICYLASVFNDGGHTNLEAPLIDVINNFPETNVGAVLAERLYDTSNPDTLTVMDIDMESYYYQQALYNLYEQRESAYEEYEIINVWDDASQSKLLCSGDTAVFVFDSFMNEAVDNFKWSLDYAKENGIKRFVIDLSCNTGGSSAVVMYMMAMMCNRDKDNNSASIRTIQTLTGNISEGYCVLDLNLDGEINDLDREVYYDFEYAILTSRFSFSCGNLLPSLARDNGIAVIGETSGGGACGVDTLFTAEVMPYTLSGYTKFINAKGEDVDAGVTPDYDLTKQVTDEYGDVIVDYSGMYNIALYSPMIDEFYGITEEPSEKPSEEPSKESSEEPSKESLPETSEESSKESSEKSTDEHSQKTEEQVTDKSAVETTPNVSKSSDNNAVATGDSNDAQFVILMMLMASVTIVVFGRKKYSAPVSKK